MKHIVIVGGSFTGVGTAHRILKQASKLSTTPFKITLISRDSHFYWIIAIPRGVIPGQLSDDQLFQPIEPGFSLYPAGKFEFIQGSASAINIVNKTIEISDTTDKIRTLSYDTLILGTGSRLAGGLPFKSIGTTDSTKVALHEFQAQVKKARSIAIIGGGPTGVELAGQLEAEYGRDKDLILISSGTSVLEGHAASVSNTATKYLNAIGVDIRLNAKVNKPVKNIEGRQELTLPDGEKLVVDLCIPVYGITANSSYIPKEFLNDQGFVKVDNYLQIVGAEDVYAIGDVSDCGPPQYWSAEKQSTHIAKNLIRTLTGRMPIAYKPYTGGILAVLLGKKAGTGYFGNFTLPGFVVVMLRKAFFIDWLPQYVNGSRF